MPTKKIYTNTLAQIGGKVITAIISIVMIKIITGYLDMAGYGLYSKIYNYLSIFAVIADLGLYTITVRELTKYEHDEKMIAKISGNVLSLRTLSGIVIIFLALSIAPFLSGYNSTSAYIGIFITSLFTLFGLINSSIMSYLQATLRTEFSIIATTSGKLVTFALILFFASIVFPKESGVSEELKYTLIMLAGLAGNIIMTGFTWWYANRFHPVRFAWDKEYIQHIIKISLPYGIALFLGVLFFKVDTILLSVMEEAHIADIAVALYSVPMKIVEVGMMYGTIFLNSLLPVLTKSIEQKESEKTEKLMKHGFQLLFAFGAGISLFLTLFAKDIIRLISTEEYTKTTLLGGTSVEALQIVSWIFLFYFLSSLFTYTLIAKGEQKKMMYINACVALLNIIGNIIFIPHFSFIGSAWVTLITQILLVMLTGYFGRENLKGVWILKNTFFFLMTSAIAGIGALLVNKWLFMDFGDSFLEVFLKLSCLGVVFWVIFLLPGIVLIRKNR